MTNMNNPMKDMGMHPHEVDSKDLPSGFITARECSKWMLKHFSKFYAIDLIQRLYEENWQPSRTRKS